MTHDPFSPLNTCGSKHFYLKLTKLSSCSCLRTCSHAMKFIVHAKVYMIEAYENLGSVLKRNILE